MVIIVCLFPFKALGVTTQKQNSHASTKSTIDPPNREDVHDTSTV